MTQFILFCKRSVQEALSVKQIKTIIWKLRWYLTIKEIHHFPKKKVYFLKTFKVSLKSLSFTFTLIKAFPKAIDFNYLKIIIEIY